jgi:ketosteroid isomerase-like protein
MVTATLDRAGIDALFVAMAADTDADASAGLFHDDFLSLDPARVTVLTRDQLRASLPLRRELFASIGASGTTLRHLDLQPLDDRHVFARTTWDVTFTDAAAAPLALESTYLLRRVGDRWQVVVYLNHQDVLAEITGRRAARKPTDDDREDR